MPMWLGDQAASGKARRRAPPARTAPMSWATTYITLRRASILPAIHSPNVTAGLKWPPETAPSDETMHREDEPVGEGDAEQAGSRRSERDEHDRACPDDEEQARPDGLRDERGRQLAVHPVTPLSRVLGAGATRPVCRPGRVSRRAVPMARRAGGRRRDGPGRGGRRAPTGRPRSRGPGPTAIEPWRSSRTALGQWLARRSCRDP